LDSTDLDYTQ